MPRILTAPITFAILALLAACATPPPKPSVDYDIEHAFADDMKIGFYALSGSVTGDNPMQLTDFQKESGSGKSEATPRLLADRELEEPAACVPRGQHAAHAW